MQTLTYLNLSNNGLDDDKARMLASGLVENLSITHLDLSHNKVRQQPIILHLVLHTALPTTALRFIFISSLPY